MSSPFTSCSTVISQACTPAEAMLPSRKKPKNSSIGRVSSNSRPDRLGPVASVWRTWSASTRLCSRMVATTGTPSAPSRMRAPRQPMTDAQQRDGGRPGGKAGIAGEGVQREGAAHALLWHRAGEDRVVGRVDDRVADAAERGQGEDLPERGGEPHRADRERHEQRAANQERPRAVRSTMKPTGVCSSAVMPLISATVMPTSAKVTLNCAARR